MKSTGPKTPLWKVSIYCDMVVAQHGQLPITHDVPCPKDDVGRKFHIAHDAHQEGHVHPPKALANVHG